MSSFFSNPSTPAANSATNSAANSATNSAANSTVDSTMKPGPRHVSFLSQSLLLFLLLSLSPPLANSKGVLYKWMDATATFYGGENGEGTIGGACGYGNTYSTGYGLMTAAASISIWAYGLECGTCWEVVCNQPTHCITTKSIIVTVTNFCPGGGEGWCNPGNRHLDMSMNAYLKMASYVSGIVKTKMRRVQCAKKGNIGFFITGNPWYYSILVFNVGGPGNIRKVKVQTSGGKWVTMDHQWGQIWTTSATMLLNKAVSFYLETYYPSRKLTIKNGLPSNWNFGGTYYSGSQYEFRTKASSRKKKIVGRSNLEIGEGNLGVKVGPKMSLRGGLEIGSMGLEIGSKFKSGLFEKNGERKESENLVTNVPTKEGNFSNLLTNLTNSTNLTHSKNSGNSTILSNLTKSTNSINSINLKNSANSTSSPDSSNSTDSTAYLKKEENSGEKGVFLVGSKRIKSILESLRHRQ